MYAVVQTGGKQYRVHEGGEIRVETLPAEVGTDVVLDKVLMVNDDSQVRVGQPFLEGRVTCEVVEHGRGDKVFVFKHKRRKDYRRRAGHRQDYTRLKVKNIEA
jgi:large subunit ribosomal protein L21